MKIRTEDYFVKIKPELLFETNGIFKSFYTPWVYAYLKLDYNYNIQKAPGIFYEIKIKPIANFFLVHRTTIDRAFDELISHGLLEKRGKIYKLISEVNFVQSITTETTGNYIDFVKFNNNDFIYLINEFQTKCEHYIEYPKSLLKAVQIYYYLITMNRHFLEKTDMKLSYEINTRLSKESQSSLSRILKHDHSVTRFALHSLKELGFITYNDNSKIKTVLISKQRENNLTGNNIVMPLTLHETDSPIEESNENFDERTFKDSIEIPENRYSDKDDNCYKKETVVAKQKPVASKDNHNNSTKEVTLSELMSYRKMFENGTSDNSLEILGALDISIEKILQLA